MNTNENVKVFPLDEVSHYHVYGRTDMSQRPLPLFWNGSGVEVVVTGTELWVDVEVDFDNFEPWVCTYVDDAFMSRQMLLPGTYSVCLFRNMTAEGVKKIGFFRELQAMTEDYGCHVLIHGFRTDGAFLPVPEKKCKLEFIGDSITSGEGTYGPKGDQPWISMFMSSSRNYATMTARALDADFRLLSQGGWGAFCGWDNDPRHRLPSYYEPICGLGWGQENEKLGAQKPNPFESWQPDAIVVNLGTNDCSAFSQPMWKNEETGETFKQRTNPDGSFVAEDTARFEASVISFLQVLRKNNPDAQIVWVYGMLGYDLTLPLSHAVSTYQAESGDAKVHFLNLPNTTEETVGCRFHPGVLSHQQSAAVITDYLKSLLGL